MFVITAKPSLSSPLYLQLPSHGISAKDLVFMIPISSFGIVSDRYVLKYVVYTNEAFTRDFLYKLPTKNKLTANLEIM